jgi:hypothetical protein
MVLGLAGHKFETKNIFKNVSAHVSDAMGHIQELHPQGFDIKKLDKELQLMAMLRVLPCAK